MDQEKITAEIEKLQKEREDLIRDKAVLESDIKNLSKELGVQEGDDINKLLEEANEALSKEEAKLQTLVDEYEQANGK